MGTRALIHIKKGDFHSETLLTIYRQFDGYPEGLGQEIYDILNKGNALLVNGFGTDSKIPETFNGMGCLAAYLVGALKKEIGNVYINTVDSKDVNEDYTYTLYCRQNYKEEMELFIAVKCSHEDDVYCSRLKYYELILKQFELQSDYDERE